MTNNQQLLPFNICSRTNSPMTNSLNVAVIGAGISGLLTSRELLRQNHRITVFEKSNQIGGTWVYDDRVEVDGCLLLDPNRSVVHSSLYSSLRTNLPRPMMGFIDYSFEDRSYGDPRMFPGHREVLRFLQGFANEFGVTEFIRFNSEVVRVESRNGGFVVEWQTKKVGSAEEVFDAVVVCIGHYTEPRVANDVPGIEEWSRKQLHSHNYRVPEPYQDQVVVVIGSGPSALDISREIATTAKEVHLSSRSSNVKVSMVDGYQNMWQHMKIKRVFDDGTVVFQDDDSIVADVILHCTGYALLLGMTMGILFRMLELQAKWVAFTLSGKIMLPSKEEMLADVYKQYQQMDENGILKSYTHSLNFQFEYVDWLAAQVGLRVDDRLKEIAINNFENIKTHPNGYRDVFAL
ncbi:hypothetical protein R6Q57_016088 [Mikania cordata]